MSYIPQKKAQIMYNSFSGRKNRIFEEKKIFLKSLILCVSLVVRSAQRWTVVSCLCSWDLCSTGEVRRRNVDRMEARAANNAVG